MLVQRRTHAVPAETDVLTIAFLQQGNRSFATVMVLKPTISAVIKSNFDHIIFT